MNHPNRSYVYPKKYTHKYSQNERTTDSKSASKKWWEKGYGKEDEASSASSYGIEDLERENELSRRIGQLEDRKERQKMKGRKRVKF